MADLELARHQWEDGRRAIQRSRTDGARHADLIRRVEVITAELNRRVGQTFTLADLAAVYAASDRWVLEAIHDAFPDERPGEVSAATDAAFDLYARRALDYAP
jgi:hypothetical protein